MTKKGLPSEVAKRMTFEEQPADDPRRPAFDANRQAEIEAVKPVIERLKETGWTFGSHTWGHIRLDMDGMNEWLDAHGCKSVTEIIGAIK